MGKNVFISYSHAQSDWVTNRLAPLLRASGVSIIRDLEASDAGVALNPQMDKWVDAGDVMLAVISPQYLASKACRYEWARGLARDPGFASGRLVPILRAGDKLPPKVAAANPLYVDLREEDFADREDATVNGHWEKVLKATGGDLGAPPLAWLNALTRTVALIREQKSVNLVASNPAKWRELLRESKTLLGDLPIIDLGDVVNRRTKRGFLEKMLQALSLHHALPAEPGEDVYQFSQRVRTGRHARLGVAHFEACWRWSDVDGELFDTLRHHTTSDINTGHIDLSMIVHTTTAMQSLPDHHPVSVFQPVEIILNQPGGR